MKVSEITSQTLLEYLRHDDPSTYETEQLLPAILTAAKEYIKGYTGLTGEEIDQHEDLWLPAMILCQDMFDNRTYYVDKANMNKAVENILDLHVTAKTLLGGE